MKTFLHLLRIAGAIALALLIWFAGPLIAVADYHPLEPSWARMLLISLLALYWLTRFVLGRWRVRSGNRKLFDGLAAQPAGEAPGPGASLAQIRERFDKAAKLLKELRFADPHGKRSGPGMFAGRRYAYQLPWYLFIGAPGSGKTTALRHSGLQFPLAEALGNDPLQGIGGTRNCEWWFTDQAVLIDTAGRYTTQDSDAASDAAEWRQFIGLVKRFRPRQPINGVLATISAADLLQADAAMLQRQAEAIHARLAELHRYLGHAFPVYLLVTKTDLVAGFTEFFGDLDHEQREQVWGFTAPFDSLGGSANRGGDALAACRGQLDALEARLFTQCLPRLQGSHDSQVRALQYGFPGQWVQLKEAAIDFAKTAFAPNRLTGPLWLRGMYFTSGVQEGAPIDRVLGALGRSLGFEHRLLAPQRPSGKSFFITGLLRDVVFPEAVLAGTDAVAERRVQHLKWGGMAVAAAITAVVIGTWAVSYLGNAAYIDAVHDKTAAFAQQLEKGRPSPSDLPRLLAYLDTARSLAHTDAVDPDAPPLRLRAGLFQGEKLQSGADQAYARLLSAYLAPALAQRIEARLRADPDKSGTPELQYEALKAYLMLHRLGTPDLPAMKSWVAFDLDSESALHRQPEVQRQVLTHLDALLDRDALVPVATADSGTVQAVRNRLLRAPFAQRVYSRVLRQNTAGGLKEFRFVDAGGPNAQILFTRRSGQPVSNGVPPIYTADGYRKVFNAQLDGTLRQLAAEETWVLGVADSDNARRAADTTARTALADEVRRLYLQDYATVWENYIADIALVKSASLAQSIEQARILSGPDSPLPPLMRGLAQQVTLTPPPSPAAGKADNLIDQGKAKLGALLGSAMPALPDTTNDVRVETIVDARFDGLRRFVRGNGPNQPAPVDAVPGLVNELYKLLTTTEAALKAGNALPQSDVPDRIRAEAGRMPEPARSMLATLAEASTQQAVSGGRANLGASLAQLVGEPCRRTLAGRYPFAPASKLDAAPEDVARMLAREGVMDDFFRRHLAPVVDTSTRPWRFRNLGVPDSGGISQALIQFERAQEIRDTLFPPGSNGLNLRLDLRPFDVDAAIASLTMDIDGQLLTYPIGPPVPMTVLWPGPRAGSRATLEVLFARGGGDMLVFDGPWALFRLFDKARITATSQPERFVATFRVAGHRVSLDVNTHSARNPFRIPALQAFQCPSSL